MFTSILQLIYPKQCCACKEVLLFGEEFICVSCLLAIPRCNLPQEKSNYLLEKFEGKFSVETVLAFAWFVEQGRMQAIMHEIKYKGNIQFGQFMGRKFAKAFQDELSQLRIDMVVPVPLHPKRKRQRGYNQSEEIAKGLTNYLNIPLVNDLLIRTKYAASLVDLDRESRFEQLQNSFEVISKDLCGKNILLLDDTLTTGATCIAAGKKLKDAGASRISIACLAVVR